MIEKIAKYLILSLLGLCVLTFAVVLVVDDETIESTTGPAAETLLGIKHGVYDTVSAKSESFVYWIRTSIHEVLNFSPTNRVPRVVMRVPPPPKEIERAPAAEPEAAPEPAMPESEPAGQPENMPAAEEARPGEADYQQGLKYYNGDGVEQNFGKAAQFFLKAGDAGHVGAQYNLGIMNYTGQTGGQDFANAAKWFERAAGSGHTQAQYNLGFLYYEGKGVAQDLKTAFDWINRAAEQGYPKAIKARDAFKQAMPEMFESKQDAKPVN